MSAIETGSLLVLAAVGLGITYFGYEATQALLAYGGAAAGGAIGGWLGFVFAPQFIAGTLGSTELLAVAGVCMLVGAMIGRSLIPSLGRLAITCLSFTLAAAAAFVVASEGGALETISQTIPRILETGDTDLLYDRFAEIEFIGGTDPEIAMLGIVLVAVLAAAVALAHADFVITILVTILGALLLAAVVPILVGGVSLDADAITSAFSTLWFLFFLISGVVFEGIRYSEELELGDFV